MNYDKAYELQKAMRESEEYKAFDGCASCC